MIHILGMESYLFESWINPITKEKYGKNFPLKSYIDPLYPKKNFTILYTPNAKKFSEKKWNRTEFAPGIPMGIELEDGGGEYTALLHPEIRVYFDEIMCGIVNPPSKITDLVLSLLEDMGWYNINYSFADVSTWGEGISEEKPFLTNFPVGPPQKVFPKNYLCEDNDLTRTTLCSHDYQHLASCSPVVNVTCPGIKGSYDEIFCDSVEFYNPNQEKTRGKSHAFDFIKRKTHVIPNIGFISCGQNPRNGQFQTTSLSEEFKMNFGPQSLCTKITGIRENDFLDISGCYEMKCLSNNHIQIKIEEEFIDCSYENQIINISNPKIKNIICPDPKYICYIQNKDSSSNRSIPTTTKDILPVNEKKNNQKTLLFLFLFSLIGIIVFILILSLYIYRINSEKTELETPLSL